MSEYLASYDLAETDSDPHKKFLEIAQKDGWFSLGMDDLTSNPTALPNTTITKTCNSMNEAIQSLQRVASTTEALGYDIKLTKVAIVEVAAERYWDDSSFKF